MNDTILKWVEFNEMIVKTSKTKEILFLRPKLRLHVDVMLLFEHVNEVKFLGVIFSNKSGFDLHAIFSQNFCGQRAHIQYIKEIQR